MTVSIGRINIDYYLESAAAGDGAQIGTRDLTAYYTETQAPAGRWAGRGLESVGLVSGQQVTKWAAKSIYEQFTHPESGKELGARPITAATAPEGAKTPIGNAARAAREAVAGFDLTFSPPKSVSVLWALANPKLQADLYEAHKQAVEECMDWLERNVIQARAGHGGVAWVAVEGAIASMFDHWDSRAGDPQLHTHTVIANRVRRVSDGKWVTLDSYTLHRNMVAVSEKYNSILFDRIYDRTGAVAEIRDGTAGLAGTDAEDLLKQLGEADKDPRDARAELAGIPDGLITEFSSRSLEVEALTDTLVAEWVEQYGKRPPQAMVLKMRQQATLFSRTAKQPSTESLPEKMIGWRQRALDSGYSPASVIRDAVGHDVAVVANADLGQDVVDALGKFCLHDASSRRTTFTRANLIASTERLLRGVRMGSAADREQLVDRVVEAAAVTAVALSPERMSMPEAGNPFLSIRGRSSFEHEETKRFTTTQILDDEAFLIAGTTATAPALDADETRTALTLARTREGRPLSEDQAAAAQAVLCSGTAIDGIIGPAGTGKTTTMKAVRDVWEGTHGTGSVIGLAPSAVAAAVLGEEIDAPTDNVAKWLYESVGDGAARRAVQISKLEAIVDRHQSSIKGSPAKGGARDRAQTRLNAACTRLATKYAEQAKYRMRPGQLVILDEASMVGTAAAAELARQADDAGAKLLLVGDAAQIDAVEAGGFLGWLERNTNPPILTSVWRFSAEWERTASLRLRTGDPDILATYLEQGRIHGCPEGTAPDRAYQAWMEDTKEDITASLLIAGDNGTVNDLNIRAQLDLAAAGRVNLETSVNLRSGVAGTGDLILARQNDRRLKDSEGHFIKNGTRLAVTTIRPDGSVTATRTDTGALIELDPDYLHASVELGYACTSHRSQGVTVDSAHTVVSPGLARELFYVAMTRGRHGNTCYVDLPDPEEEHAPDEWGMVRKILPEDAMAVLKGVLGNQAHEMTAHEVRDAEHGYANDFARMVFEYDYAGSSEKTSTMLDWLDANLSPERKEEITTDRLFTALVHAGPPLNSANPENASVEEMLKAATTESATDSPRSDVGVVTAAFAPATAEGRRIQQLLQDKISARLDQLIPPLAGDDSPDWVNELREEHQETENFPATVRAVTAWREVSGQQDAETPWGTPPKSTDKTMTDYYERARKHLPPRPTNAHSAEPEDVWANVSFAEDDERLRFAEQLTEEFENLDTLETIPVDWDRTPTPGPDEIQPADIDAAWEL
ncbi:MobF family relaxase (plasmid) [Pseudarthrobacter sp. O4]|uniref:MobF family relaxase n=1 Tax=Pseudarthrobacter sp. O4 TaxID=3418417 RepID=UPI003CEFFF74